jgi:hypothetical protein
MRNVVARSGAAVLSAACLLLIAPMARSGADETQKALAKAGSRQAAIALIAEKIQTIISSNEFAKEHGKKTRIDLIPASGHFAANPSPGVETDLRRELTRRGLYDPEAAVYLVGRIESHETAGGKVTVLLSARLMKNGEEISSRVQSAVRGSHATAMVGASGEPDPTTDASDLRDTLDRLPRTTVPRPKDSSSEDGRGIGNPVVIAGSKIQAIETGKFSMEIIVASGDRLGPCPVKLDNARGALNKYFFTELRRDEEFHVRLQNNSDWEVIAALEVDGLNVLNVFRGTTNLGFVVPANKSVVIQGWQLDDDSVGTFKIVQFADSVFFKKTRLTKNLPGELGSITATFTRSWDPKTGKPPAGGNGVNDGDAAVGTGKLAESRVRSVPRYYEDQPYSVITVRYRR